MIEISYQSSNGNKYNLIGDKMRATAGNFHKYAWEKNANKLDYGEDLIGFKKAAVTYTLTLQLRGNLESRKKLLNELRNDFEIDILTGVPGTIRFGEYYIKGFVTDSETKTSELQSSWSQDTIQIYCPYPFWIKEISQSYHTFANSSTKNKNYPGRYACRYVNGMTSSYVINDHFTDADFAIRIYGPVTNPQVTIGGYPYPVNVALEDGERLEIDSRNTTIIKYLHNGTPVNVFHCRQKGRQFFRKIPPGRNEVSWTGKYDFDLILYAERSEPEW